MVDNTETKSPGGVSIEFLDLVDEDLHENDQSRATGFVGLSSEVQWLRSFLRLESARDLSTNVTTLKQCLHSTAGANKEQVYDVSFYLDSENIGLSSDADQYRLPSTDVAEGLVNTYMEKVHDSFPILSRQLFESQFRKYLKDSSQDKAPRLNQKWEAVLNLVFAISSKYSHVSNVNWHADRWDYFAYHARARSLTWNKSTLIQHPDLP